MALTATTLNGALTAGQTTVTLTTGTGALVGMVIVVDSEAMLITDITNSPTFSVVRGFNNGTQSTAAVAHNTLAPATFGLTSDYTTLPPAGIKGQQNFLSFSASGAVTIPPSNQTIVLNSTSVIALTLGTPNADIRSALTFTSQGLGSQAHTITCPSAIIEGSTAGLSRVITFAAEPGMGVTLQALAGKWNVIGSAGLLTYST